MNWNDIKIFLAIANAKGLKKAARRLGIHHSSCARRINILENDMGIQLFNRLPSGYSLTSVGEELLLSAEQIEDGFNTINRDLLGKDLRIEGDLCLTLTNGLATHLLMPDLEEFMRLYPGIRLEINMTYSNRDLASREADVAIRHVNNPPDSLYGKRVARIFSSAYASNEYLASHDLINEPELCHWLGWGNSTKHLKWAVKNEFPNIPVKGNMYSDVLQLAAIQAHAGIASLPCYLADNLEGISRISKAPVIAEDWIWILVHKDMARNARVKALMDFLAPVFLKYQSIFQGDTINNWK